MQGQAAEVERALGRRDLNPAHHALLQAIEEEELRRAFELDRNDTSLPAPTVPAAVEAAALARRHGVADPHGPRCVAPDRREFSCERARGLVPDEARPRRGVCSDVQAGRLRTTLPRTPVAGRGSSR